MASCAVLEFAWWAVAWTAGISPAPLLMVYLAGAMAAFGVALGARLLVGRSGPLPSRLSLMMGVLIIATSASLFLPLKFAIPNEIPFWLDSPLARWERVFGVDPWVVLDALFGKATPAFDFVYAGWVPTQLVIMFIVMLQPPSAQKSRSMIAYSLSWLVLGVGAAVAFSSAGPIFYDRLYGGSNFAALTETLRARGATLAITETDAMWKAYATNQPGLVAGISAMPSLHVAISFWMVLTARSLAPRFTWLAIAYFLFIWVASVQLGWHYLADGLFGAFGVLAIWALARPLEARLTAALPCRA